MAHIGETGYQNSVHNMYMNLATPKEVGQLPHILHARRNLKLKLSERQVEILTGAVLGDGYIYPSGKVQLEHSAKGKNYLLWKFHEFKNLAYEKLGSVARIDKRNGKKYVSNRFWLRQYFAAWRRYFYRGKRKIFPIGLKLTPLSLAVWYMDDGCYSDKICTISTDNFSVRSLRRIKRELKYLGLNAYIRSNGKIGISARSHEKFFTLIRPYIHESMKYKLP